MHERAHDTRDPRDGWTGRRPFVGRSVELERAGTLLERALAGQGAILFVLGHQGAGKRRFVGRILETNDARAIPLSVLDARVADGLNIWERLNRRVTRWRRIRRFFSAVIPEWAATIPVLGPLISAILHSIRALRGEEDAEPSEVRITARRHAGTVSAVDELFAGLRGPAIIVVRDLERAGDDDLAGAFHALRLLASHPVLVIATVNLGAVQGHAGVRDLIRETERYAAGEVLELTGLTPDQWALALAEATGAAPPPAWVRWFAEHEPLLPGELWTLLGQAARLDGITSGSNGWRWSNAPDAQALDSLNDSPDVLLASLTVQDRDLLAHATAGGPSFSVLDVQARTGLDELAIQDRLARLERERWVQFVGTRGAGAEESDWYRIDRPGLLTALRAWSRRVAEDRSATPT